MEEKPLGATVAFERDARLLALVSVVEILPGEERGFLEMAAARDKNERQAPDTQREREATEQLRESSFCPLMNASYHQLIATAEDLLHPDARDDILRHASK